MLSTHPSEPATAIRGTESWHVRAISARHVSQILLNSLNMGLIIYTSQMWKLRFKVKDLPRVTQLTGGVESPILLV